MVRRSNPYRWKDRLGRLQLVGSQQERREKLPKQHESTSCPGYRSQERQKQAAGSSVSVRGPCTTERQNEINQADPPEHQGERFGCSGSCSCSLRELLTAAGGLTHPVLREPITSRGGSFTVTQITSSIQRKQYWQRRVEGAIPISLRLALFNDLTSKIRDVPISRMLDTWDKQRVCGRNRSPKVPIVETACVRQRRGDQDVRRDQYWL